MPLYAGIETLRTTGDQVQWGGPRLCAGWVFPTPGRQGRTSRRSCPRSGVCPRGAFVLSTRRGKQFNTMVFREHDPHRRPPGRLFISADDAGRLGVDEGDALLVRSENGHVAARAHIARMRPGNVQMFFPECNPLIAAGRRDSSGVPDYNAIVEVLPAP